MSNGSLNSEVMWMIGVTVAAVIAIAIAAVAVSATVLQLSRIADMRDHELRTRASNSGAIHELQRLVDAMRDDYRDRMQGVDDVLYELQAIRQSLDAGAEFNAAHRGDLERTLSNLQQALTALLVVRPVGTSDLTQRLEEIRDELQAIKAGLEDAQPPGPASAGPPEPASAQPREPASPNHESP